MSVMNHNSYLLSFSCIALTLLALNRPTAADDAGGLDMNALASLASTIGSNPQIMSMVSGLFNQNSAKPSSGAGANNGIDAASALAGSPADPQDSGQQLGMPGAATAAATAAAADTGMPQAARPPAAAPLQPKTPSMGGGGGGSLGSLMSLLPALTQAKTPAAAQPAAVVAAPVVAPAQAVVATPAVQTPVAAQTPAAVATASASGGNPAQAVINQVLTAYASGQIPPEMIQLGLSGRVPPQIMELALSGSVPPQIIQMVITGQIPMSTINSFLSTMQPASRSGAADATAAAAAGTSGSSGAVAASSSGGSGGGIVSTTRALVEALFKPSANGGRKIMVPTLLGPLPIQIPNIPSVRQFGQMVGSSITNMANMVPF